MLLRDGRLEEAKDGTETLGSKKDTPRGPPWLGASGWVFEMVLQTQGWLLALLVG